MNLQELRTHLDEAGFSMWSVVLGPVDPQAWDVFGVTLRDGRWLVYYTEGRGLVPIADFETEAEAAEFFREFADKNLPRTPVGP